MSTWKELFSAGARGDDPKEGKRKKSFQERHKERMAAMSDEDKAERRRKMKEQGMTYEDGGVAKKNGYFCKIKSAVNVKKIKK